MRLWFLEKYTSCEVFFLVKSTIHDIVGGMQKKTKIIVIVGAVVLFALAYYALSPLWRTVLLEEAVPASATTTSSARPIVDTAAHPASGTVSVFTSGTEAILRYENFKTINGPDLKVYLSTDLKATEFVDLGVLKATEGNVNYSIPTGTDLQKYRYALVWCEQFGVLFNSADLRSE